jgi:hypothetical protein
MDALSYEQIAEAMETTVPSVKSLLVRARVSLAEAAEARLLSCDEVRIELGEVAEGLKRRPSPLVRRHMRSCKRCTVFRSQLRQTNKALAALMPIGPFILLKKLAIFHLGQSAGAGSGATAAGSSAGAAGAGAAGMGAAAGGGALAGSGMAGGSGVISAGLGAIATKAAAGLAAAALVTAGAVEAGHSAGHHLIRGTVAAVSPHAPAEQAAVAPLATHLERRSTDPVASRSRTDAAKSGQADKTAKTTTTTPQQTTSLKQATTTKTAGRDQTQTDPTVLAAPGSGPNTSIGTTSTGQSTTPPPSTTTGSTNTGSSSTTTTSTTSTDQSSTTTTQTTSSSDQSSSSGG